MISVVTLITGNIRVHSKPNAGFVVEQVLTRIPIHLRQVHVLQDIMTVKENVLYAANITSIITINVLHAINYSYTRL